jgi:glucose/arabinose dehydrogenase
MRLPYIAVCAALFILVILCVMYALGMFSSRLKPGETRGETASSTDAAAYRIEEVVQGLEVPWSIVFTSPTRILVSERPGRIRIIENGKLLEKPLHTFPEVSTGGEEGLMSLAIHPDYAHTKFVYASYASMTERGMQVQVVRFKDDGDSISDIQTILTGIPATQYHAGSRLKFGPDGKLYITTGDATDKALPQDKDSLGGKILRLNDDGFVPSDNPFKNAVWSYGHRNPQGISWDSKGNLYETEHGPSTFDGPPGGDEVNRIEKGANYGWPLVSHERYLDGTIHPLLVFTPAEAPASALIYSGKLFPQWKDALFFGALVGEGLIRVAFDPTDHDKVATYEKLSDVKFGRIRDVTEGPDGAIYFSTSNHDGRGDPAASDDRIFRITTQ